MNKVLAPSPYKRGIDFRLECVEGVGKSDALGSGLS
jgi:hypothetical protein